MANRLNIIITVAVTTLLPIAVNAHHNASSHYLLDQTLIVEGVVTQFRLINPHIRIYFDVTTEDGQVEQWLAEGQAAAVLNRRGWTEEMLRPGDAIKITGYPARDGGNTIDWQSIELSDGTVLHGGTTELQQNRKNLLEELDKRRREQ